MSNSVALGPRNNGLRFVRTGDLGASVRLGGLQTDDDPPEDAPEYMRINAEKKIIFRARLNRGTRNSPANLYTTLRILREPFDVLANRLRAAALNTTPWIDQRQNGQALAKRTGGILTRGAHENRRARVLKRILKGLVDNTPYANQNILGVAWNKTLYSLENSMGGIGDWVNINQSLTVDNSVLFNEFSNALVIGGTINNDLEMMIDLPVFSYRFRGVQQEFNIGAIRNHFYDLIRALPEYSYREGKTGRKNKKWLKVFTLRIDPYGLYRIDQRQNRQSFDGSLLAAYQSGSMRALGDPDGGAPALFNDGRVYVNHFWGFTREQLPESPFRLQEGQNIFNIATEEDYFQRDVFTETITEILDYFNGLYGQNNSELEITGLGIGFKMVEARFDTDRRGIITRALTAHSGGLTATRLANVLNLLRDFKPEDLEFKIPKGLGCYFVGERFIHSSESAGLLNEHPISAENCRTRAFLKWVWVWANTHGSNKENNQLFTLRDIYLMMTGQTDAYDHVYKTWREVYDIQNTLEGHAWITYIMTVVEWVNWCVYQVLVSDDATVVDPSLILFPQRIVEKAPTFVLFEYIGKVTNGATVRTKIKHHVDIIQANKLSEFEVSLSKIKRLGGFIPLRYKNRGRDVKRTEEMNGAKAYWEGAVTATFSYQRKLWGFQRTLKEEEKKEKEENEAFEASKTIFVSWDIETMVTSERPPFLSVLYFPPNDVVKEEHYEIFEGGDCVKKTWYFLKELAKNGADLKVWTFNGSRFDVMYILPYIEEASLSGSATFMKRILARFENPEKDGFSGSIEFIDLALTLQGSLNSLAKTFGVGEKAESGGFQHYTSLESIEKNIGMKKVIKYCKQDTKLVFDIYTKFRETVNKEFGKEYIPKTFISASSLAFKIWLKNFYKFDSLKPLKGLLQCEYDEIKNSYFGGYSMVFEKRMTHGFYYDINSAYPSVMCGKMPTFIDKRFKKRGDIDAILMGRRDPDKVYLFKLSSFKFPPDTYAPSIPCRVAQGNLYPLESTSINESWVWDHLLDNIFRTSKDFECEIVEIISFHTDTIFKKMIEEIYPMKQNPNPAIKAFVKLLLNSVYGKTGQRQFPDRVLRGGYKEKADFKEVLKEIQSFDRTYNPKNPKTLKEFSKLSFGGAVSYILDYDSSSETPTHPGSLVFIASYITSMARLKLISMIQECVAVGNYPKYCDTDSLVLEFELPNGYIHSTTLGLWKLEAEIMEAWFFGSKTYIYRDRNGNEVKKMKGIPAEVLKEVDLWKLSEADLQVKLGQTWHRKWGEVISIDMTKKLRQTLNRRIFNKEGKSRPLRNVLEFKDLI